MANSTKDKLFLFMQDFDDNEAPDGAWQAQLEDAVDTFNEAYETNYDPFESWLEYIQWANKPN